MRLSALSPVIAVLLAFAGSAALLRSQDLPPALQFDFCPAGGKPQPGFVLVTPSSRYSPERTFGLLSDSLTAIGNPRLARAIGQTAADGLAKDGPIDFRVDLPAGAYAMELVMDGGRQMTWRGEISVNGNLLDTVIAPFRRSTEEESVPPYWGYLRKFTTADDHMVLRVHARGQRTTVNSVALYPLSEWPVRFVEGSFHRTAAASAPNFDLGLKLVNRGEIAEASRIIDAIPPQWNIDRAFLLLALASRPEAQTPRQIVESASAILSREFSATHNEALRLPLRLAELYTTADLHYRQAGWQWAKDLTRMGIFNNCEIAGVSAAEAASIVDFPLWPATIWHLARTCYWLWVEQHSHPMIVKADSLFRIYREIFPHSPLVRTYLGGSGTPVADVTVSPGVPRWAALQNAAANRLKGIIHYWCETRQASNGEFGGKYDDDVEMLRWWPFARVGIDDSLTLVGMRRLVDGIWNSDWISNGWCAEVRDVEHSSEPVADTQPMMIAFDYGNPVYVERCMQSVKLALDLWTAKNSRGHRHFRSSWYSSTQVDTTTPKDCDVPYNTRTVKAIRWFAWYTRHPEALKFLREWAEAWLDDCMRTDKGKPAGIVPSAIKFSDDAIGGHADNWHQPGLFWDYYNYRGGDDMMAEFLSCYRLFGDPKYLKPIELALTLVQKYSSDTTETVAPGSEAWTAKILSRSDNFWEVVEIWRLLTGDTRFDALLQRNGSPYLKYRLGSDKRAIEESLTGLLHLIDRTYPLITGEGYFTDRIEIRNQRGRDENRASLLESMYLGTPLASLTYPFSEVFWKGTDSTLSALVERASPTALRIRVFSHAATPKGGSATFLRLEPGEYEIVQGTDADGDGEIESAARREFLRFTRRSASCSFTFAPRREELIVVRQTKPMADGDSAACDIAITSSELKVSKEGGEAVVTIPVHNIGTADATEVVAELATVSGEPAVTAKASIALIAAPLDLQPKAATVTFRIPDRAGRYTIRVAGCHGIPEITTENNAIEFSL